MRSHTVRCLIVAATLACPHLADAGTLTTPLMPVAGTASVLCVATNVGKTEAEVVIIAKNIFGGTQNPVSGSCPNPLDVGDSCTANFGGNVDVWCAFQVKGKVKASINAMDSGSNPLASLPATK